MEITSLKAFTVVATGPQKSKNMLQVLGRGSENK